MDENIKPFIVITFLVALVVVPVYSQSSQPRTQSSRVTKNDSPIRTKSVAVRPTNSQRTHHINKQWEKNTTLGMYSNFPSKTNRHSKQNFNIDINPDENEPGNTDAQEKSGVKKKEKESFWKKFKLFGKE
ncbi:MAG: hypothetical protein CMG41_02295 [Candidatus Marinimicrobia bacterium]|nr:hypothetical protein [Candidatus Neomarinimicrobiota bacterium]|tara:strand:+ start:1527 stop:1916 length:390 start_codon:yes stop_codon:yes gene_type:complete